MSAKDIILKPLNSKKANEFVKKHHYSWKVVNNSQLHFWVYYNWFLWWVMSYGPSTKKCNLINLVEWTKWNEFIELNRMAFSDILPKYSESRAIAISIKLLKKKAPHLKWIVSFADGCQCWDWTIYRASWFDLSQVTENTWMRIAPDWKTYSQVTYYAHKPNEMKEFKTWTKLKWFMLRYIKVIQPNLQKNYEVLPYSKIDEMWAWMYKWIKKIVD